MAGTPCRRWWDAVEVAGGGAGAGGSGGGCGLSCWSFGGARGVVRRSGVGRKRSGARRQLLVGTKEEDGHGGAQKPNYGPKLAINELGSKYGPK